MTCQFKSWSSINKLYQHHTAMVIRIRPGRATAVCVAFRPFVHMKMLTIRLFHPSVNNRNVTHAKCCGEELFAGSTFESRKVKSVAQSGLSLFG